MPKKKQHFQSKPATSYVHPSLAARAADQQHAGPTSVNDRLEQLRRIQGHRATPQDLSASRYAPKPKGHRRVAGPPPPRSWVLPANDDEGFSAQGSQANAARPRPPRLSALPGMSMPAEHSLLDHALHSISQDIEWHVDFDRHYLSLLPLEIRGQLLSYIACYGPNEGISMAGLRCLFATDEGLESQGAIAADALKRLDLAGSVGRGVPLKDLERSWTKKSRAKVKQGPDPVLDSWEEEVDLHGLTLDSPLWFPSLTHLSLACPPPGISWTDLLSLSRNLSALTHLSLGSWPRPSLPKTPGAQSLGETVAASSDAGDEDDARVVLRVFSRNTPSLEWLAISRCHGWFDDLSPRRSDFGKAAGRVPPARPPRRTLGAANQAVHFSERGDGDDAAHGGAEYGAEWTGAWRHIRRVELSQERLPAGLASWDLRAVLQGRVATVQGPTWEADMRMPGRDAAERYRIVAPTEEIRMSIEQQQARRTWLANEAKALALAAKVRGLRGLKGLGRCEFEYGWGKAELLAIGYDEHVLFEAGL